MLLRLYSYYADSDPNKKPIDPEYSQVNGHAPRNLVHANGRPLGGHGHLPDPDRAVRDAEEFELDGLMTDDEDDEVENKHHANGRA